MGSKVKITKRNIKEDKFTTSMLLAKNWLEQRWQVVAIIAAIVVVVVIGIVYISGTQETKKVEASERLTMAITKLRQMNYQEAILDLGQIADDFGGRVGGKAQFYLGNAHYDSRNYDEAITNYQKFIDEYKSDKLMTASAIAGIAACMESKGEFPAAGDKYYEAVTYFPESASSGDYYLGAIRCYVLAKDLSKAEQAYTELEEKFVGSEYLRVATRLMMSLKTG